MNYLISVLLFSVSLASFASVELRVGDILLQPLDCYTCKLIEEEEDSIYSHMGLVIQVMPEIRIAESLGTVRLVSLEDFQARTEKKQRIGVFRFKHRGTVQRLQENRYELIQLFYNYFEGLPYDSDFLWDNHDASGAEKLYCSEMITKLLASFSNRPLPMKRMTYKKNRDLWVKYFNGTPPEGKWGNSPADFEKSKLFFEVGKL
jgi:hypothetical protein